MTTGSFIFTLFFFIGGIIAVLAEYEYSRLKAMKRRTIMENDRRSLLTKRDISHEVDDS